MKQVKRVSVSLMFICIVASFVMASCNGADTKKQETPVVETPPTSTVAPEAPKAPADTLVHDSTRTEQNPPAIRKVK